VPTFSAVYITNAAAGPTVLICQVVAQARSCPMSTQPYLSPDLESRRSKGSGAGARCRGEQFVEGAEQQVGAGEQLEPRGADQDDLAPRNKAVSRGTVSRAELDRPDQVPTRPERCQSATEAEDRGGEEQRLRDDEEASELDEALEDTFPASDLPARTTNKLFDLAA
jgi:hypothetical protein